MALPTVREIADLPADRLPGAVMVPRLARGFDVVIRPPGSKSITNRALLLAALAEGTSVLRGALLEADDAKVMVRALEQLGAAIRIEQTEEERACGNATLHVTGVAGRWKPRERGTVLNLNNAGTATRFLTAAVMLSDPAMGAVTIDGNARMRERPIGELVDLLWAMGVDVRDGGRAGHLPIAVHPPGSLGELQPRLGVPTTQSSQFVSALMLVGAMLPRGLHLLIRKPITSEPYLRMSQNLLGRLGVSIACVSRADVESMRIAPVGTAAEPAPESPGVGGAEYYAARPVGKLKAFELDVEPDFSGASYFWAAGALVAGSRVSIEARRAGGGGASEGGFLQGDSGFIDLLRDAFGAEAGVEGGRIWCRGTGELAATHPEIDLEAMPDTAMTAAAVACFATPTAANPTATTMLKGLKTLRVKETDRLAALQTELSKLGGEVEIVTSRGDEALRITPARDLASSPVCLPASVGGGPAVVEFDTYDDHRMAMSLALIGLRRGNVVIRDPGCVRKTYPTFWRDLAKLYG